MLPTTKRYLMNICSEHLLDGKEGDGNVPGKIDIRQNSLNCCCLGKDWTK